MSSFLVKGFLSLVCLTGGIFLDALVNNFPSEAQISSDGTTNTQVTSNDNTLVIDGGTTLGTNLFHSFQEFSLPTGQTAFFNNQTAIKNILGRVTGGNLSEINGLIKTNGAANLFLINPQGIIFGPNAQLDIGGSFFASTAESIKFTDGYSFSVSSIAAPLLTLNIPIGLQFGANPGSIINQSRATSGSSEIVGLQLPIGQSLALVGGDVSLVGGQLRVPQGQIDIGSVGSNSFVSLIPVGNSFSLGYDTVNNFSDIKLLQQAVVNANGVGGGKINIQGANILLTDNSQIVADTLGNIDGYGITIRANQLTVQKGAFVSASTFGESAGGTLKVNASSVEITSDGKLQELLDQLFSGKTIFPYQLGSGLFSLSYSGGRANNLSLETETLSLREGALISTTPFGKGKGGEMIVKASESIELIGSEFLANSFGDGNAGLVTVETGKLFISEGAGIFASTSGAGQAGTMNITAKDSIDIIGTTPDGRFKSGILTNSFSEAKGAAGNLRIETGRLTIRDGAGIGAATFGEADGGNLTVIVRDLVEVIGTSADGKELSNFVTLSQGTGAAGDIEVVTKRLVVRDGGVISTATLQAGRAGRLVIRASDSVELTGTSADQKFPSGLRSDASSSASTSSFLPPPRTDMLGEAGDLTIETGRLMVSNGAQITVSGEGSGAAGNITVQADSIWLEDHSQIKATTFSQGGGNINLTTQDLRLRRSSKISTDANNTDGGNIIIDTNTLVALENSDITANAEQGRGGRVSISAQGIFGTEFRKKLTEESDITATSELGPEFSGSVEINNPEVDPSRGLIKLPVEVVDPTKLIAISCSAVLDNNTFVVTGRGGLPPDPIEIFSQTAVWIDWRGAELAVQHQQVSDQSLISDSPATVTTRSIIEAQGWVIHGNGQVELVTNPNGSMAEGSRYTPAGCGSKQG